MAADSPWFPTVARIRTFGPVVINNRVGCLLIRR